jgi:hypothetical protein
VAYFLPIIRSLPLFGKPAASWLWTVNPSLGFLGQGIITGPIIPLHMLLGTVVGWGILSPIAKHMSWAPGPVGDWDQGSRGWIVWVSFATLMADCLIKLGWLITKPLGDSAKIDCSDCNLKNALAISRQKMFALHQIFGNKNNHAAARDSEPSDTLEPTEEDVLLDQSASLAATDIGDGGEQPIPQISIFGTRNWIICLLVSIALCIAVTKIAFPTSVPLYASILVILMSLVMCLMGVQALGETDFIPAGGIGMRPTLSHLLPLNGSIEKHCPWLAKYRVQSPPFPFLQSRGSF